MISTDIKIIESWVLFVTICLFSIKIKHDHIKFRFSTKILAKFQDMLDLERLIHVKSYEPTRFQS